jgi:CO/xanthine dehydrogenase FAD-binding subunit
VSLASGEHPRDIPLERLLDELALPAATIITAVTIKTSGQTAAARTARTPADRPIVAAVARRAAGGQWRLALTGVADRPVLAHLTDSLDPPGDFRGSGEYRRALAAVLTARVLDQLAASGPHSAGLPHPAGAGAPEVTR